MTDAPAHNLSRAKIQRLLTAVGSTAAQATAQPEVALYNWRDPHYFDEEQRNRLAAVMSQVAALLSESNVTPASVTQHFANDLSGQIALENSFCLAFGSDVEHPCGFLSVAADTAMSWVTFLLGDSDADSDPKRALSALEESLLSDVVTALTEAFLNALQPHHDLRHGGSFVKGSSNVQFDPTEEICIIVFEVRRADANEPSQMSFVLPCRILAPLVGRPLESTGKAPSPEELQCIMTEHLQQMPVVITAKLSSTRLSFEEVLDLSQNDIVLLDTRIDEPIDLTIDGQTIFRGRPARSDGQRAILLTECTADRALKTLKAPAAK
jgi:flagellar motor switch protein FliM